MHSVSEGKDYIRLLVGGKAPEKEYILYGEPGDLHQADDVIEYEARLREIVSKEAHGWTVTDRHGDMDRADYTPLYMEIKVEGSPACLIKQVKCISDALRGAAYTDDSSIVRLRAEYTPAEIDCTKVFISPYRSMPHLEDAMLIDTRISPVRNVGRRNNGTPLDTEAAKKDGMMIQNIRAEVDDKMLDIIDGPYKLEAIFATKDINKSVPFINRIAMADGKMANTYRPDVDNLAFSLIAALHGYQLDANDLQILDVAKTYYSEELSQARNIIKISNIGGKIS